MGKVKWCTLCQRSVQPTSGLEGVGGCLLLVFCLVLVPSTFGLSMLVYGLIVLVLSVGKRCPICRGTQFGQPPREHRVRRQTRKKPST